MGFTNTIPKYLITKAFTELRSEICGDDRPRKIMKLIKRIQENIMDVRTNKHASFTDPDIKEPMGELVYEIADYWGHNHSDNDTRQNAADTAYDMVFKCIDDLDNKRIEYIEDF